jgi:D-tagatose-bisphosphate aldolase class II non-catalytic subunit
MQVKLEQLASLRNAGTPCGIFSVCSAHPVVLRAALRHGRETGSTVLIEATCNQVNHQGGYTGMRPADFAALVFNIANDEGCPPELIVLGGDHLGPNPWRFLPAESAMAEAAAMVSAYVAAGFRKIHLDASMGCANEPDALDDVTTANRAAKLARVAEEVSKRMDGAMPLYIIGTEVPPPGGADHVLDSITPTNALAAIRTLAIHRDVFRKAQLQAALDRAIGLVVQPGVEFGNSNVIGYKRDNANDLIQVLNSESSKIFEAHSTDYQGLRALTELVEDGFAILKVGPELTFVLREALYALDLIATDLLPDYGNRPLYHAMEDIMLTKPEYWESHYAGDTASTRMLRHYSLSDRIRYYWAMPEAKQAVDRLMASLRGQQLSLPILLQHLPGATHFADTPLQPEEVLIWRVGQSLATYHAACKVSHASTDKI